MMLKHILTLGSATVLIIHVGILYCWIFAWEQLVTTTGIALWAGSIFAGLMIYAGYRKFDRSGTVGMLSRRVVLSSTLVAMVLAAFAIIIQYTTSSMI